MEIRYKPLDSTAAVPLRSVLERLEFQSAWGLMTDQEPSYRYDFGNFVLTAAEVTNEHFAPVFYFGGVTTGRNSLFEISFEVPVLVESFEQGTAWIAYGIGPKVPMRNRPRWMDDGLSLRELLPWVRHRRELEKRSEEAANAPHCVVEREWLRLAMTKLGKARGRRPTNGPLCFRFDGQILRLSVGDATVALVATGKAWEGEYRVQGEVLYRIKRFTQEHVELRPASAWMTIGRQRWPLLSDDAPLCE